MMTWQSIKTAPRNGRFFIAANTEEVIACNWPKQRKIDYPPGNWKRSRGEWDGAWIKINSPLTHWKELPALPLSPPCPPVIRPSNDPEAVEQPIKAALRNGKNWDRLTPGQQCALDMIAHKLGRVLSGADPGDPEHWKDLTGHPLAVMRLHP